MHDVYFNVTLAVLSIKLPPLSMTSVLLFKPPWHRGVWFKDAVVWNDSASEIRSDSSLLIQWGKKIKNVVKRYFYSCSLFNGQISLDGYLSGTLDVIIYLKKIKINAAKLSFCDNYWARWTLAGMLFFKQSAWVETLWEDVGVWKDAQ